MINIYSKKRCDLFWFLVSIVYISLVFAQCNNKNNTKIYSKSFKKHKIQIVNGRTYKTIDTSVQNILLIGDSQAYFFMKGFKRYTNTNFHKLTTISWVSASIKTFAITDTITKYLKNIKPSYVIVLLGTNQLSFKDTDKMINDIKKIKTSLKNHKTVWVGPLKRKRSLGLNTIFEQTLNKDCFFRSDTLKISRKKGDWTHPSTIGSQIWADIVVKWIIKYSKYPINLEITTDETQYNYSKSVLKPYDISQK